MTRVAREVGTEGKLGGQADVPGVAGTWKDLTDNVNSMAGNLTGQVRNIAEVTTAVAQRRPVDEDHRRRARARSCELKNTINTMVDQLNAFAAEVTRVAREVGTEGKLGGQAEVPGVAGTWKDLTDNVNFDGRQPDRPGAQHRRGDDRGRQRRPVAEDHGRRAAARSWSSRTPSTRWSTSSASFAAEVTRVAREVGTEGKLGGQADVPGVAGTWKDLTDNVNFDGRATSPPRCATSPR